VPSDVFGRFWKALITGDGLRKSRLHTYSGERVDLAGLAYFPRALWSRILLALGHRQRVPWLGYRAVERMGELVQPEWSVLEFGSGMSTLFFARRCRRVVSIESDPAWYRRMLEIFAELGITNVDLRLRDRAAYTSHPDLPDGSFDLVVVDGIIRDRTMPVAVRKARPGGYVFMDNSDVPWDEHKAARRTLLDAAVPGSVERFNDFCPFQVIVNESMLVRVPAE
jgi:protein-L-isoaspartate O-methyltransferase